MLVKRAVLKGVVLVPGKDFMVDDKKQCQYMRAAFSCATKEQMWKVGGLAYLLMVECGLSYRACCFVRLINDWCKELSL